MAFFPIEVRPDPRGRGWQPKQGWYLFDVCAREFVEFDRPFATRREAWKEIAKRAGVSVWRAKRITRNTWCEED